MPKDHTGKKNGVLVQVWGMAPLNRSKNVNVCGCFKRPRALEKFSPCAVSLPERYVLLRALDKSPDSVNNAFNVDVTLPVLALIHCL